MAPSQTLSHKLASLSAELRERIYLAMSFESLHALFKTNRFFYGDPELRRILFRKEWFRFRLHSELLQPYLDDREKAMTYSDGGRGMNELVISLRYREVLQRLAIDVQRWSALDEGQSLKLLDALVHPNVFPHLVGIVLYVLPGQVESKWPLPDIDWLSKDASDSHFSWSSHYIVYRKFARSKVGDLEFSKWEEVDQEAEVYRSGPPLDLDNVLSMYRIEGPWRLYQEREWWDYAAASMNSSSNPIQLIQHHTLRDQLTTNHEQFLENIVDTREKNPEGFDLAWQTQCAEVKSFRERCPSDLREIIVPVHEFKRREMSREAEIRELARLVNDFSVDARFDLEFPTPPSGRQVC